MRVITGEQSFREHKEIYALGRLHNQTESERAKKVYEKMIILKVKKHSRA